MKNYSYLINKHFKVNKRRNLFTIVGIVFSIILFISVSYVNNYMKDINIANAKHERGNYEAIFKNVYINDINKIINNIKVQDYGFYKLENSLEVEIEDINKTLEINALDNYALQKMFKEKLEIVEGQLPSKSGEVALTNLAKSELGKNLGDTLSIGQDKYIIVGFYEDSKYDYIRKLTGISYLDVDKVSGNINILCSFKSKNTKIDDIKEITTILGKDYDPSYTGSDVRLNEMLLYAYGIDTSDEIGLLNQEKITMLAINIVIILFTILFIYSSINISFKERVQQFSTLRCLGATPSKIRYMLLKESLFLGVFSIVPGVILGVSLSWFIINVVFNKIIGLANYGTEFTIYYDVILLAVISTIINILIATIIPVLMASNISPLDGAKTGDISNIKIKRKQSKLIRKIFGYNGELAYKNIASNNKSFYIITLTLTVLLITFTSFSGFYIFTIKDYDNNLKKAFDINSSYNTQIYEDKNLSGQMGRVNNMKKDFVNTNVVKDISMDLSISINPRFEGFEENPKLKNYEDNNYNENGVFISKMSMMLIYDEPSIKEIISKIDTKSAAISEVSIEDFENNGFIIVNSGYVNSKPPFIAKTKDIDMFIDSDKNSLIKAQYLGSIDHRDLVGAERFGYYNNLTIIVSSDFYYNNKDVLDNFNSGINNININLNYDDKDSNVAFSKIKEVLSKYGADYMQPKKQLEDMRNSIDALSVVIYTVLMLAMTIGAINIVNTRIINIILRKKEFGTLLAVGMNSRNIKKLIILEGIVQWFISSVIGVILSIISLNIIRIIMFYSTGYKSYNIPSGIIATGVIIILIINLLSSIVPYNKLKGLDISEFLRHDE